MTSAVAARFAVSVFDEGASMDGAFEVDESWFVDVGDATGRAGAFVARWLATEGLRCCHLQGGFLIDVDGRSWNEGCVDEYWMTMQWLPGLRRAIADGEARSMFWEESQLNLRVDGDALEFWDGREGRAPVLPRVRVGLRAFVTEMTREARRYVAFADAVRAELARRDPSDPRAKVVTDNVVIPAEGTLGDLDALETWLASTS